MENAFISKDCDTKYIGQSKSRSVNIRFNKPIYALSDEKQSVIK